MLKFILKYLIFAPTSFGTSGPSSGSLHLAWLLHFRRNNQERYSVISKAVLWQHVVCVLGAVQRANRTLHGIQYTHHNLKHMLPQHCVTYNDVSFLIISTKV
jgi:hypothetical protein